MTQARSEQKINILQLSLNEFTVIYIFLNGLGFLQQTNYLANLLQKHILHFMFIFLRNTVSKIYIDNLLNTESDNFHK